MWSVGFEKGQNVTRVTQGGWEPPDQTISQQPRRWEGRWIQPGNRTSMSHTFPVWVAPFSVPHQLASFHKLNFEKQNQGMGRYLDGILFLSLT